MRIFGEILAKSCWVKPQVCSFVMSTFVGFCFHFEGFVGLVGLVSILLGFVVISSLCRFYRFCEFCGGLFSILWAFV